MRHPSHGVVSRTRPRAPSPRGEVFPPDWLSNHINQKGRCGLYHLLRQFCTRQPGPAAAGEVLIDVENPSVVCTFNRGWAKNRETHAFLVQSFELQVEYGLRLSSKLIPTAGNKVMDAISRPPRKAIVRITPVSVQVVWDEIGPFKVDLEACTASVLRSPFTGRPRYWRATFRLFRVP